MPPSRLSTVFDLSGLRLHSDGSLVTQDAHNTNLRRSRRTVRDAHGKWIAKDAGGLVTVPRYRKVQAAQKEEGEGEGHDDSNNLDTASNSHEEDDTVPGKKTRFKTSRARKRRKFATDEDYLGPVEGRADLQEHHEDSGLELRPHATPSSDLLKCIHHYASMYYDERGLLLNASKEYRRERKKRRLTKLSQGGKMKGRSHADDADSEEDEDDDDDLFEDEESHPGSEEPEHLQTQKVSRKTQDIADMYKTMDGSALMAIGMLLQEHVAELLRPQLVSDWSDEVEEDGTREVDGVNEGRIPFMGLRDSPADDEPALKIGSS